MALLPADLFLTPAGALVDGCLCENFFGGLPRFLCPSALFGAVPDKQEIHQYLESVSDTLRKNGFI